jgi:NhaP-type Na+/H+ or K+/H+ antiporter
VQSIAEAIAFVGILVFVAHLFTGIFSRTRIPDVIFLMIIGFCVGPVLELTSPSQFGVVGPVFTTITLIIILFESGIALRLNTLKSALGGAMTLAPLSFFATMAVVAGVVLWLTDLELIPAFIIGAIVGSTSEAVVIPLVKQLRMRDETQTLLSVESSVNDVLAIVITVALIEAYKLGKFEVASVAGDLIASFLVAVVFGIAGAFVWSILLNRIHAIKNTIFTTPAFVFVLYGLVEVLGFSGAIAALAFGITIGNIGTIKIPIFKILQAKESVGLTETERIFFSEVAFLLKTFFFVYLGISIELISSWLLTVGLVLTIFAFFIRIPAVKLTIGKEVPVKDKSLVAVMVPKGLAAVVLASIPFQEGLVGGDLIKNITYGVVMLSIVMTSILVLLIDKTKFADLYAWVFSPGFPRIQFASRTLSGKPLNKVSKISPAGSKLFGQGKNNQDD